MPIKSPDPVKQKWQMEYERTGPNESSFNLVLKLNDGETANIVVGHIDCETGVLVERPFNTQHWDQSKFLTPKYKNIRTIKIQLPPGVKVPESEDASVEEDYVSSSSFWGKMPIGLYYGFRGGLGLYYRNDFIVEEIEKIWNCNQLTIGFTELPIEIDGKTLNLSIDHFENWIRELDRISGRGQSAIARVKSNYIQNDLACITGGALAELKYGRKKDSQYVTHMANNDLSDSDTKGLIEDAIKQITGSRAGKNSIPRIKREIEIASLDVLIESFEAGLTKKHNEQYWQHFFEVNPFALQQIMATPFTLIAPHAHVETGGLFGNGASITDFFGKNTITNNICIVEIKKPTTPLINKTKYRDGVYSISKDLSGSVIQIADQASSLMSNIHEHRSKSGLIEMQAHNVRKCILIGNTKEFNDDDEMVKSFELYRQVAANISIITYDEALGQLKTLRFFLASTSE